MKIPFKLNFDRENLRKGLREGAKFGARFDLEVFNNKEEMKLIGKTFGYNIVTDEGLDAILDIMFHASTQITTWYCVISETNTAPDGDETYAVPDFTEWTAYDEANRQEFVEAAASSQEITNSANKASMTANASKTLYGAGLVGGGSGASTKGDTAGGGTLFDYALFTGGSQAVQDDNVVNLTVTISAADDGA